MGGPGCAIASTAINWMAALAGLIVMLRAAPFRRLQVFARGSWPARAPLLGLLRLGLPMGISYLIEVTSYAFMALFIARFGTHTLAAHQIAGNVGTVLYMIPMSIGIATATLVALAIGRGRRDEARAISRHGILLAFSIAVVLAVLLMLSRHVIAAAYTPDPSVIHTAVGLLSIVAVYHVFDAVQVSTAFVLRSYRVSVVPTLIYAFALWGVGLGGGYVMGFDVAHVLPAGWRGANGFWIANTASLALAAFALSVYRALIVRR
jgi:MATE family multidrug resistance protein